MVTLQIIKIYINTNPIEQHKIFHLRSFLPISRRIEGREREGLSLRPEPCDRHQHPREYKVRVVTFSPKFVDHA